MAQRVLGPLTIGQAPHADVVPIVDDHVPEAVRRIDLYGSDPILREAIAAAERQSRRRG